MVSSTTSAVTSVTLIVLVGVSGAYAFVALGGMPSDRSPDTPFQDPDTILVRFPLFDAESVTAELPLRSDGTLTIDPFPIAVTNITEISITMHANITGLTFNDQFNIRFVAPNGDDRNGFAEGQASTTGYRTSQEVVADWRRASVPKEEHHDTSDRGVALARAAANHTRPESTGDWRIEVAMTPPGSPLLPREGKIIFVFQLKYFSAAALPVGADAPPDGPDVPDTEEGETDTAVPQARRRASRTR